MKKEIFENVSSISGKIWRGNKEPQIEPDDKTTLEYKEYNFNDSSKYIRTFSKDQEKILNQFPEYLAHYTPIATNTGLMCFYNETTKILVIYDLLAKGSDNLADILPDINPMLSYDHIKTPMNVRQLNFKDGSFIPEHMYIKDGKTYYFYNCDKIGDKLPDINNNDYFESIEDEVSEVKFKYKPLFVIRAFKNSGEQYTDSVDKNNNNEINDNIYNTANLIKKENGIYYADISDKNSTEYFTLKAPSGSGYLEVL